MSDTPRKQPPFTDCPKTEKVFPFKRMDDGHWYRYQSDAIDFCEKLERENAALREDKERLDWLEQSTFYPISATGESVRVAIDAARKSGHETDFVTKKKKQP